jgi:hypothetical protein
MKSTDQQYKTETVPIDIEYNGKRYNGYAKPLADACSEDVCYELDVTLNNEHLGTISCGKNLQWTIRNFEDQGLVDKIGEEILLWYE